MKPLSQIREDLKEIRYYYLHKADFDETTKIVGSNTVMEKINLYHEAVKSAPPQLYNLYAGLYIRGNTQEGLSIEMGYTPEYIHVQNKRLLLFLQSKL